MEKQKKMLKWLVGHVLYFLIVEAEQETDEIEFDSKEEVTAWIAEDEGLEDFRSLLDGYADSPGFEHKFNDPEWLYPNSGNSEDDVLEILEMPADKYIQMIYEIDTTGW